MISLELGNMIKENRIKQNISQQKLADMTGVTKRAIAYWESGKKSITIDNADKIFRALETTVTLGAVPDNGKR